jgi:hypothetical protein
MFQLLETLLDCVDMKKPRRPSQDKKNVTINQRLFMLAGVLFDLETNTIGNMEYKKNNAAKINSSRQPNIKHS